LIILIVDPIKWWTCCRRVCRRCTPNGKPGRKWREMRNRQLDFRSMVIFFSLIPKLFLRKIHTAGLYCYYRRRANPTFLSQSVSACIKYVSRLQDTTENTRI